MESINRPFKAFLDGDEVQVNSYDFIDKIRSKALEDNYNLKIQTTKEIEKRIYLKVRNKTKINFKCEFSKLGFDLNLMLELNYLCSGDMDLKYNLLESTYEVINYKHI